MNHLAAEWEKSRVVGGRGDGKPDLADDSVNRSNHNYSTESAVQTGGYQEDCVSLLQCLLLPFIYLSHLFISFKFVFSRITGLVVCTDQSSCVCICMCVCV